VRVSSGKVLLGVPGLRSLDEAEPTTPGLQLANFFAGDSSLRGGVRVALRDVNGDRRADLLAGSGQNEAARVRVYRAGVLLANGPAEQELDPFGGAVLANGVFVG
jgi:hypothetical protein